MHQRMRFGWAVEAGVLIVFFSPILWGVSALLDLPYGVQLAFMWLTVFLVVVALASMVAVPFITRSERRSWSRFTAPSGIDYRPRDDGLAERFAGFPAFPFDLGPAELQVTDVLRATYDGVPALSFTLVRKMPNEPRDVYQMVAAELPGPLPYLGLKVPMELRGPGLRGPRVQIEYAEFNERYLVSTYDESAAARKYAVDVLHPRAVQQLLAHEPHDLTMAGRYAVSTGYPSGKPDHAVRLLQTHGKAVAAVVRGIPAHVYATYGGGGR